MFMSLISCACGRPVRGTLVAAAIAIALVAPSIARAQVAQAEPEYTGDDRIEKWKGKTVLAVTPHPDDETFTSGGLLSMLAANGNNVQILIYTTDNAGSNDPLMTKEKLAEIRRQEEEDACAILGIPKDHITWLGHDDGTYELVTQNLPILTTLRGWKYGFNSPFKAEIYFISTRKFTDLKWGTPGPATMRDR